MSTKADILALALRYGAAASGADSILLDTDYTEVVEALDPVELLVDVRLLEHGDDATLAAPGGALRILAAWYDGRQLAATDRVQLESRTPEWRDRRGPAQAFVTETEGDRCFRLYPKPDAPSRPMEFAHGLPFGIDFPVDGVPVAYTEVRPQLPDWLDLPVALAMLARGYAREERYRDPTFAAATRKLADLLLGMAL